MEALIGLAGRKIGCWALVAGALALLPAALALNPDRQITQYRQQTWQSDSGLPQNTVHAIVQTRDGFLWLATEGGLVRFDGYNFRVFDTANTPAFRSDLVDGLLEDRQGGLWIATSDGLIEMRGGSFQMFHVEQGLPSNVVMGVYQQSSGRLIALTAGGLAVADGGRFRKIAGTAMLGEASQVSVLPADAQRTLWAASGQHLIAVAAGAMTASAPIASAVGLINALAADTGDVLWVGGANGLECLRGGEPCAGRGALESGILMPAEDITALAMGKTGELWIGTASGLKILNHGKILSAAGDPGLGGVQRLFVDRSGAVWVAFDKGLARVVGDRVQTVSQAGSLDRSLAILEDREGDLWFGGEAGGLTVLREQPFSDLTTQQGLSADFVRTVFQGRDGAILIGTDKGGLDRIVDGKVSPVNTGGPLASRVVLALAETGADLWIGTPDGLTRIRAGHPQTFTTEDGLADNFVRSLFADSDGSLWIGTRNGLSHWTAGKFVSYTSADGLGSDVIGSVVRAREGTLWVGTLDGLSRWDGRRFVNYTAHDDLGGGLGGGAVTTLFEDAEDTLWIGTNAGGLTRLRGGKFAALDSSRTGLPGTVYGIVEDGSGHLWMGSKQGIYRVSVEALNAFADKSASDLPVERFGAADGMRIGECSSGGHPSAWRMQDGTLWFATIKGVAWVDPNEVRRQSPPPVAIEGISLDGREADWAQARAGEGTNVEKNPAVVEVPAGRARIAIQYAGLSLAAPQKVRYRYKLEGFDRGWVQAGAGRTAYYTNVPPGRYRFVAAASNMEGVWSTLPAVVEFDVHRRFFQTWWFDTLVAAALFWIGYLLYRLRVRYVEARLHGVMAERGRIAREIHDTLAQGYAGISVQLEIASQLLGHSQEAARAQLEETKALVRSGLEEARRSIWELRSQTEGAQSLPARLTALVKRRQHGGKPEITLAVHGSYRALPGPVEDEIFRVAQEAVQNALRHAEADRIGISLTYDAKNVELDVRDDGRGFTGETGSFAGRGHFGLKGMEERAAAIGGVLAVDGRPGQGTVVRLRVKTQTRTERESEG